jgi:hypothetical protein
MVAVAIDDVAVSVVRVAIDILGGAYATIGACVFFAITSEEDGDVTLVVVAATGLTTTASVVVILAAVGLATEALFEPTFVIE